MSNNLDLIKEESERLCERIKVTYDVTDYFISNTMGYGDRVAMATLTNEIVKYCEMRGISAEEFAQDLAHSVRLMVNYR